MIDYNLFSVHGLKATIKVLTDNLQVHLDNNDNNEINKTRKELRSANYILSKKQKESANVKQIIGL